MGRKIFITATDTGAGKTFITANLIRLLLEQDIEQGISASAIKPVASGISNRGINEDVEALMQAQQLGDPEQLNLYSFQLPASPHIAAAAEGREIDPARLTRWCEQQSNKVDLCLIEGVGGLMVPLDNPYLVSDWISDIEDCEVMLVVGARLGSINHTLLTLEQLKRMGRAPDYVVINQLDSNDMVEQTEATIAAHLPASSAIFSLPFNADQQDFSLLTKAILAK